MQNLTLYNWLIAHRHPIFLVGLLLFFILPELIEKIFFLSIPFPILIALLIFSSILLIHTSPSKRVLTYGLVVVLIGFIMIWSKYQESQNLTKVAYLFLFTYFSFITFYLFVDLLRSKEVTASVIIGAFAGYFMIGVMAFFVFAFLDSAYPDTLSLDINTPNGAENTFYFSFITLTTIGYGDFVPISSLGQKFAILVGLTGQFYLAIIMAILVGKFLSNRPKH